MKRSLVGSLLLAATLLRGGAVAHADEISGADKLRMAWSNQFAWTREGVPLVTVRLAEGRDEVTIAGVASTKPASPRVLPDGEGGPEVVAGTTWKVRLAAPAQPATCQPTSVTIIAPGPGSTLLNPKTMFDGVVSGTADIGCLAMSYQPGRFPVSEAIDQPIGFSSAKAASLALLDKAQDDAPALGVDARGLVERRAFKGHLFSPSVFAPRATGSPRRRPHAIPSCSTSPTNPPCLVES